MEREIKDAWRWAQRELVRRNEEVRVGKQKITIELYSVMRIKGDDNWSFSGLAAMFRFCIMYYMVFLHSVHQPRKRLEELLKETSQNLLARRVIRRLRNAKREAQPHRI